MKCQLTALVTLGATLAVGLASAQQPTAIQPGQPLPPGTKIVTSNGQKLPPNAKVMRIDDPAVIDHLATALNLTPAQKKKFAAVHTELAKKLKAAKGPDDIKKVFAWREAEMKKILTPEQLKKSQAMFHTRTVKKS